MTTKLEKILKKKYKAAVKKLHWLLKPKLRGFRNLSEAEKRIQKNLGGKSFGCGKKLGVNDMAKITLSEVNKKHLKIIGFLTVSAVLAYVLSLLADKPELVYLAPLINYVLYFLKLELDKEGYVQVIRNK